jgi:hypothetical protein
MTLDQMRARMRDTLGASPIPDASLTQYAALAVALSQTIDTAARGLAPEDAADDFTAFLEGFAEAARDD